MKNGALYIRVSTHMQDELSPDAQQRLLLDYAKDHDILISDKYIFIETGISGKRADRRPQFQNMISLAKSTPTPFHVILVWKFSRFARNQEESILYKSLLRKQCHVEVISVSEPIMDGPFGSLIERIIEWMDEYYSIRLSGEVMKGMTEKAMRGGYQARPPLGYKIIEKKKPPVIVPQEVPIIQYIFDAYANQNHGIYEIARHLNQMGYLTQRGKSFERRSVEYILLNPMYCGMLRWNKRSNITKQIKEESEWIIRKGEHPAIISEELYQKAVNRYYSEYQPRNVRPSCTYKHWLSGVLKCPDCGRTMIANTTKSGKNHYFICYGHSKGICLPNNNISSAKLEPTILLALKHALQIKTISYHYIPPQNTTYIGQKDSLFHQLSRLEQKEKRAKDAYINGIDTLEEYKKNKTILQNERIQINNKIEKLSNSASSSTSSILNETKHMPEHIHSAYDILISETDIETKNHILKHIVQKIIYDKKTDQLKIYYLNHYLDKEK